MSLLPIPRKLIEKIVHDRITQFSDAHKVLSVHQGVLCKGFSTTATIDDLTDDLFSNVNQGMTTLWNSLPPADRNTGVYKDFKENRRKEIIAPLLVID